MEQKRWRQALAISVLLNLAVLIAIGVWAGSFHAPVEELIELDLITAASPLVAGGEMAHPSPVQNEITERMQTASAAAAASQEKMTMSQPQFSGEAADLAGQTVSRADISHEAGDAQGASGGAGETVRSRTLQPPRILLRIEPVYPQAARRQGAEGLVHVRIKVGVDGSASSVSIAMSSGYPILDNAAIEAVGQWRFIPAKEVETGSSVPCITMVPVVFRLNS